MAKPVTRRDFLNGVAIGAGGLLLQGYSGTGARAAQSRPTALSDSLSASYYPPTLTGMRGSHEGSFEVAHALGLAR